ncbi:YceI family protein [candidate division CSSED10-310 bacterium]|uniref:YceI family protein n=1 Tax=candidate division CSSED10-310 bacterium TaxID=2855610 RepID=A0ABV6Z2H8_UNCC1
MNITKKLIIFGLTLVIVTSGWGADTFVVDKAHSTVEFGVSHMVITTVKGKFNDFSGTIVYDRDDLKQWQFSGIVKVKSVDTAENRRDDHLRSPDFFDVQRYPEITFKSTKFLKQEKGYVCVGQFTMRGITKEVRIPFHLKGPIKDPYGNSRLGLAAFLTINRHDYGVNWSKTMDSGGLVVGNDVDIELNIEAIKK